MYPGAHAKTSPDKPAYIMAATGQVVTYRQLDQASNKPWSNSVKVSWNRS